MIHSDKHKAVFLCLLWLEKIRTNRTYVHKSWYAKLGLGYCGLVYYKWQRHDHSNLTKKRLKSHNLMGHSSQYHLGSVPKVLKNSSNFHHFLVSLREVNPENFRSLAFTVYFLEAFKVIRILQNFCILHFLLILEAWIIKTTFLNALNFLYS